MENLVLGIDIDGTVVLHRFPELGPPVPGAIEWLKKLQSLGCLFVLNTMRSDGPPRKGEWCNVLTDAVNYLRENGIELYGINKNPEQHTWTSSPKVYAHYYIDDAAIGCPLIYPENGDRPYVDWDKIGADILKKLGK